MRIIAGRWRGRPLVSPPGDATRPTSDRAREGLFSMVASRLGGFEDLRVADLFAGSGALGLEALSRGAAHCTFIDRDRAAISAIEANLGKLNAKALAAVRVGSVEHAAAPSLPCDLIFLDPPYDSGLAAPALQRIADPAWLTGGGWVSLEIGRTTPTLPPALELAAERRFGKALILLLRRTAG